MIGRFMLEMIKSSPLTSKTLKASGIKMGYILLVDGLTEKIKKIEITKDEQDETLTSSRGLCVNRILLSY